MKNLEILIDSARPLPDGHGGGHGGEGAMSAFPGRGEYFQVKDSKLEKQWAEGDRKSDLLKGSSTFTPRRNGVLHRRSK